jgi:predicted DNA-binding WGR domain protein
MDTPHHPPALAVTRIRLQAIDPARNIARGYEIEASPDLFGHWIIALHWGRLGTKGQSRQLSLTQPQDAARFVRTTLTRRASAKRRIGVPYKVVRWVVANPSRPIGLSMNALPPLSWS